MSGRTIGHCRVCGRPLQARRRWSGVEQEVRYCSGACRSRGIRDVDLRLEAAIEELLALRDPGATACPSEAARRVDPGEGWRRLMEPARRAARRMAHNGRLEILQGGRVVDPGSFRGPVRLRWRR